MRSVSQAIGHACALAVAILLIANVHINAEQLACPEPIMAARGERILSKDFASDSDIDKKSIQFRKQTQYTVKNGTLNVIPPLIAFKGTDNTHKWASSSMARAGLIELPPEYICQFRWKYNTPTAPKYKSQASAFIDLGHRCIRLTFTMNGTTLKLENHLVGNDAPETSILLLEDSELKLQPDHWYDITIEIAGDEVVFQIDGHVLYAQHDLIAQQRANTFNIDSGGDGYVLDHVRIWEAAETRPRWDTTRQSLHP
jgi:hypothetical protein